MVFSSITFMYYFLPIVLLIYFIVPRKFKNLVLLLSSLAFYFYGEPTYIWVLLLSCFINYMSALLIDKYRKKSKLILILAVIFEFKTLDFMAVLEGALPIKALELVREWIVLHRDELLTIWETQDFKHLPPLE